MSKRTWKCAGCGIHEPFPCNCATEVAYSPSDDASAWTSALKRDVVGRQSLMTRFRWWLFQRLSDIGWRICPPLHREQLQKITPTWAECEKKGVGT